MEQEVQVPWGQITYKFYGNDSKQPVLLIHDLHDNAASFDVLITNLSTEFCYAAVDLPGHGKSSHMLPNSMYHFFDYILALKYVVFKLGQNHDRKVILLGHGKGAHLAFVFAQVYPKRVAQLILLENVYDYGTKARDFSKKLREHAKTYFAIANELATKSPVEYTKEELLKFYKTKYDVKSRDCSLTINNLMQRGARKIDNGKYVLRNDLRLNGILMHFIGYEYSIDLLRKHPLQCPVLLIINFEMNLLNKEFLDILRRGPNVVTRIKMGDKSNEKHFHIKSPKLVAMHIDAFLNSHTKKHKL